jgi:hypothetical protein
MVCKELWTHPFLIKFGVVTRHVHTLTYESNTQTHIHTHTHAHTHTHTHAHTHTRTHTHTETHATSRFGDREKLRCLPTRLPYGRSSSRPSSRTKFLPRLRPAHSLVQASARGPVLVIFGRINGLRISLLVAAKEHRLSLVSFRDDRR